MRRLRRGPVLGLGVQAALLTLLAVSVGLSALGWTVGLVGGAVASAVVACNPAGRSAGSTPPGDRVTLARALLIGAIAALVADSFVREPAVEVLVGLSVTALMLDAVDGRVARRTRSATPFGARLDGEVDAFLILVLSVYVARSFGAWVLALGLIRYAFAAAGWVLPWLRGSLPPRYWRKVVTAVTGVALTVAASGVGSSSWAYAGLVAAAALLAESFGRDVWWLWRRRKDSSAGVDRSALHDTAPRTRRQRVFSAGVDVFALAVIWLVLVLPDQVRLLTPGMFLRIPVEALVIGGVALLLPARPRRVISLVVGGVLGLATVLKLLDMGFNAALDRPFNLVTDRGYFSPVRWLVRDAVGPVAGDLVLTAAVLVGVALVIGLPVALRRVTAVAARHRGRAAPVLVGLSVLWLVGAAAGWQAGAGGPVASASSVGETVDQVRLATSAVRGEQRFQAALSADPFRDVPDDELLAGLRGKTVLVVFVESYGRVAVDGPRASDEVRQVLADGTRTLRESGFASRSAFLTSPTFGGLSWLAHSTLQAGLWVSDQGRYDRLLSSNRMTLSRYFRRAGWRTVALMPSNRDPWPQGKRFYRFDRIDDRRDLDYAGPRFGFSLMPDQYALAAFRRLELAHPGRTPMFAQLELASSHAPWAPVPRMVDWDRLGDGSVFDAVHDQAQSAADLWRRRGDVPVAYAHSVAYSLRALISFIDRYGDDDLVVIALGDHQPATVVTGHGASRDVPISIVTRDPAVLDRISGWGWQPGLRPDGQAPVWPMDAFRDRLLGAFSGWAPR